jgi:hypothetical protein
VLVTSALLYACTTAEAADYICKEVGKKWTWLGDHVVGSIEYVVIGAPGRRYEVGTGLFVQGQPWGSKRQGEGRLDFSAYGIGALHGRQIDEGSPLKVCATTNKLRAINLLTVEF